MQFDSQNYKIVSVYNRTSATRGGSMICIKNNLKGKERKDIVSKSVERSIELSCVETNKQIIICVYRPPSSDYKLFEAVMEDVLKSVSNSNKSIMVCGDYNIDLLGETPIKKQFLNMFKSYNLFNLFLEPTRITDTSATCLDNIFCNIEVIDKSIINSLKSDHCGQLISYTTVRKNQEWRTSRPITISRIEKFVDVLRNDLPAVDSCSNDPNVVYYKLFGFLDDKYNKIFKCKKLPVKDKMKFCDWATRGIYISRNNMYNLYEQHSLTKDDNSREYIRNYSKIFKKVCKMAKANYIRRNIHSADNKIKAVWQVINKETGKSKVRNNEYVLKSGDRVVNTDTEVAQQFENFFTNIPISTTKHLNSSTNLAELLLKANVDACKCAFNFEHINPITIVKTYRSLNLKNTEDLWGISVKVINNVICDLADRLTLIFNTCVDKGIFPDLMKYSKVIPLFKSGDSAEAGNYRPVSILPTLSKVFEKVILNQVQAHFNRNDLLHNKQFGFTRGKSTIDAGIALVKHIYSAWEERDNTVGVFCDLSKAFDCVDHGILLSKLGHYGVSDSALNLLKSYLENRIQTVVINGKKSTGALVKMGVPQGSILGPFLFLVYINDLPFLVQKHSNIVLFADDTSLIFRMGRNKDKLNEINAALLGIQNWFSTNNLILNAKKTKCIQFALPNTKKVECDIVLGTEKLEYVDMTTFLGIGIDSKLQWESHINKLSSRLSSAAFAVRKIRQLTDVPTARLVYFSYFHSIMSYGILLWGNAAEVQSIFVAQKRAIRAVYNLKYRDSLRELFKEIKILTMPSQYIYENIMYVRKNIGTFDSTGDYHNINTRYRHRLTLPKMRLSKTSKSFLANSIRFYNKIPKDILELDDKKFKILIKDTLCKKGYYKIQEYLDDKDVWRT